MISTSNKAFSKLKSIFINNANEPSIFIIGAQKCATSSLHNFLTSTPYVNGGVNKEIHYFNRDIHLGASFEDYKKKFPGPSSKLYLDSTPAYLYHPGTAGKIHAYIPHAKLIVILRNPIDRAYSAWNHYKNHFDSNKYLNNIKNKPRLDGNLLYDCFYSNRVSFPSFRECLEIELELIVSEKAYEPALLRRGLYNTQLEEYFRYFSRDNILILGFRDVVESAGSVRERLSSFIGIPKLARKGSGLPKLNSHGYATPIDMADRVLLEEFYKNDNERLLNNIGELNW